MCIKFALISKNTKNYMILLFISVIIQLLYVKLIIDIVTDKEFFYSK